MRGQDPDHDDDERRAPTPFPPDGLTPEACTPDLRRRMLHHVRYFAALTHAELDEVNAIFRAVPMGAGDVLVTAGDAAERFFVTLSGRVKLSNPTPAGVEHVQDILGPGDAFGALPLLGYGANEATAEGMTDGCLLVTSAEAFGGLVTRFSSVATAVLEDVSDRLRDAHGRLRGAFGVPVEARLAAALLTLSARLGDDVDGGRTLGAPLSQEDLAALTGTTLESVNRVLAKWRRRGWVTTARRRLELRDIGALERVVALGEAGPVD